MKNTKQSPCDQLREGKDPDEGLTKEARKKIHTIQTFSIPKFQDQINGTEAGIHDINCELVAFQQDIIIGMGRVIDLNARKQKIDNEVRHLAQKLDECYAEISTIRVSKYSIEPEQPCKSEQRNIIFTKE